MEDVLETIDLLRRREKFREQRFSKMENEQIAEYNQLMTDVQTIKSESVYCKENIIRNLRFLTINKSLIYKLLQDSENVPSLPISHNTHGDAVALFAQGTDFINETSRIYETLSLDSILRRDDNTDPESLLENIVLCTDGTAIELNRVKSAIAQANAINRNISTLQKHCYEQQ